MNAYLALIANEKCVPVGRYLVAVTRLRLVEYQIDKLNGRTGTDWAHYTLVLILDLASDHFGSHTVLLPGRYFVRGEILVLGLAKLVLRV